MSSSRPSDGRPVNPAVGGRGRRWLAGLTLRTRLLVVLVALLAVVCGTIALTTEVALHRFLIHQLDEQLLDSARHAPEGVQGPPGYGPGADPGRVPSSLGPGQGRGTLIALISDGQIVRAGVNGPGGRTEAVPDSQQAVLLRLPADSRPYTRELGELGNYRLVATHISDGEVVVTGLPLADVQATLDELVAIVVVVAGLGILGAGVAGAFIVRITLRPLRRLAGTAGRVSELPLDRGEVALSERVPVMDTDPRTEVGQVGAAFNRMLGHISAALTARQASETRVRHFVADASHELRTPLAAIRGYAELARRVRDDVPPDVAHAMHRVESAATRMTALVDDLLLLARLDSGRPLELEPVDLSRLVVDAVSDAHVAGPDHHWRLELPDEPVAVTGDEQRLHQVLANLLANARTHTPPGSTVTVSVAATPAAVLLGVADDGPGIPAELLPEVFDRFARGDTSRSRAAGSTGLGLSIVAAVVEAHAGAVEVTSGPTGTTFTVSLPAR